jgi:hypothetical protein
VTLTLVPRAPCAADYVLLGGEGSDYAGAHAWRVALLAQSS